MRLWTVNFGRFSPWIHANSPSGFRSELFRVLLGDWEIPKIDENWKIQREFVSKIIIVENPRELARKSTKIQLKSPYFVIICYRFVMGLFKFFWSMFYFLSILKDSFGAIVELQNDERCNPRNNFLNISILRFLGILARERPLMTTFLCWNFRLRDFEWFDRDFANFEGLTRKRSQQWLWFCWIIL